jgi:AmiR/NasT family two-component response regulator
LGRRIRLPATNVSYRETEHLRVLIANERRDRLALVAPIVAALGHEVIAREIEVEDVGAVTARERPDVALVGLGESSEHALHLVEKIVRESACPVIALIHAPDPVFVKEASKRGVFAYITDADATDWQSSIDIVLRRFAEYHDLEGAFGRRAITERAKGILMERHSIEEGAAFELRRAPGCATLYPSELVENPAGSRVQPKPLADSLSPTLRIGRRLSCSAANQEALWPHFYQPTRQRTRFLSSGAPPFSIASTRSCARAAGGRTSPSGSPSFASALGTIATRPSG